LLRCAEALAAKGQREEAVAIFDRLRSLSSAPHQVRAGALRGAILARQQDGLALLREQLRSGDYILFAAAVKTAQELPGSQVAGALTEALGSLPADNQVVVIQALGMRADASAVPVLLKAVRHEAKSVRLTAIRALGQLGHFSAASMLITLVGDADHDCAQAAQNSLAILSGPEVDTAVMGMLRGGDVDRRATALELIGQRRMKRALPLVVKAVGDQNEKIRSGAIRVLSEVGTAAELPTLLDLLLQAKTAEDTSAAEQAVSTLCARADQPETATEKVVARLGSAQPAQKVVLLRVLGSVGGGNALQAIRASVKDSNAEVHAAAIRTLAAWKTSEALPDLLALARNDQNPTDRMLGLRGYLGWATRRDQPPDQRLAICQQAAELVKKPEEKKLLLSALGNVASPASFNLILPCLDDPAVRNEASAAVVRVAETLLKGKETGKAAQQLIKPLEKAAEAATDPDLAQRAKTALRQARARAKK
jgi:HEAT repeat protein